MSFDPSIICFKHCSSKAIFCKKVPDICPACKSSISGYVLEPFRLPNPFAKAKECPVTIVLRPSKSDFLNNYELSDDLHIGIVNSEGCIFEFDKPGIVTNDFLNWQHCLALKIVPEAWNDHWDQIIQEIIRDDDKWSQLNYNEEMFNCFDFVLEFLKQLKYKEAEFSNKEDFCHLIAPKFEDALKFIKVYRILKNVEHFLSS